MVLKDGIENLSNGNEVELKNGNLVKENGYDENNGIDNKAYSKEEIDQELEPEDKEDKNELEEKVLPAVSVGTLFQYATGLDWFFMILGTFAAIGNGVAQPISFIVFGELINKFIISDSGEAIDLEEEMTKFALYYVYIAIATIVLGYIQNTVWLLSSIRQAFEIRTKCFNSVLRQDIGWFDVIDAGEISTRMTDDITKIQNGIGDKVGSLIQGISMLLGGFIIGFIFSYKLTLVIVAMTPLILITGFLTGKVVALITSDEQLSYAKAGAIAEEVISSIRTVVAFGGEEKEIARYRTNLVDAEKSGVKKGISTGFAFGMFNAVIFGCCALGFWYGGYLVAEDEITGGDLLIVFFSVLIGAAQLGQVGPNFEAFAVARGSARFIYDVIERVPAIDSMSDSGLKPEIIGNVIFEDCEFEYPSRQEVKILKGLNLTVNCGQTVALVGESGCGKSTTIKLVQRFYDVSKGKVLIDNTDIKEINVRHLRRHIGVVSQEPVLFDTTIADNIRMGNDEATLEMIEKAAVNANAHDFIKSLPKGYETYVGEGGTQLSGGQKQRIAIARALVRNPKILLLDEATSALDTESEGIVQSALDKASEGRTTIVIAHRLSTVKKADKIAVVVEGKIAEIGTHEELMEKHGEYFKLVMLQTFEEQEEDEGGDDTSLLSESDREGLLRKQVLRTLSRMSSHDAEEDKKIEEKITKEFRRRSTFRKSAKDIRSLERQKSKINEEETDEDVNIPSMWRILKLNLKEWPYMFVGFIFSALTGAVPVVFAVIMSEVLESFILTEQPQKMKDTSAFWSIMFMVLGNVVGVSYFVAQYMFATAGEALTTRLREMAFRSLLRQEIGYFDLPQHNTGALTSRLASDASAVQGATSTRLNTLTQVLVMGLSSLIIAFVFSWKLTLVILAFVPFLAFGGAVQTKLNTSFATDEQKKMGEAGSIATESIMQIRTVASLGKEDYFYQRFLKLLLKPSQESRRSAHLFGLSFGFSMAIMFFNNAAAFRMGGYLNVNDGLSLADMIKVIISIQFGSMTAGQIASFAPDYAKAKVAAGRILDLFDRVPPIDSYSQEGIKDSLEGNVEFKDVKFHYPNRPSVPVLQGLDINIKKGQMLALVGSSGCGKSTSVSLLERFYDIYEGALTLDGKAIKSFNVRHLRSELGIVQQEPTLFDCSIRDNILYGVDTSVRKVSQEEIENVCKSSNIHHFITTLPQGYDTNVGDKGALISGGQKQRIAIARALIRNPKILLLDEATSALDSESEKVVQDALDVAMKGRTAIVIAHRLSTIQQADLIAVIQNGKVVEMGTHQELLSKKGAYHILNQAQL